MAIITSPENYAKLERYKSISSQLSHAQTPTGQPLTDAAAQALAKEGKSVIWIDGGLHATEVLGAQQLLEMVWQMVSLQDDETKRFLNDVVLLCTPANPDGMDLVSDAYMKNGNMNPPVLYNHYAGHDDNRDSYMNALPETTNVSRVMFREWYPQIMYNHHQTGPAGAVMFAPPFRDPFNYNFHPYIPAAMDIIGALISTRAIAEGKPGVVNRKASSYSTWWNGGFRTVAYFHNQLGILTETIGNPTPTDRAVHDALRDRRHEQLVPDSAAAGVALPPVDRLLDHGQPRDSRLRVALPRGAAVPHLPDGPRRDEVGQRGSLDVHAARVREGRDGDVRHLDDPDRGGAGRGQAGVTLARAAVAALVAVVAAADEAAARAVGSTRR